MKLQAFTLAACLLAPAASALAQQPVTVHGNVSADVLFPETDYKIGTEDYKDKILFNSYANAALYSKYVDAGFRVEYLEHPLPGYDPDFKGWGVPNVFVKGKFKGVEVTAGDFYEQFGSGFILRTYEERSLGIDNSIRGGRVKVNAIPGVRLTALGGVQRRFWDWNTKAPLFGADAEWDINEHIKSLNDYGITWTFGASYVLKHEKDEDIDVTGTNYRLNLPKNVSAFDIRTHFYASGLDLKAEYAFKSQDPSFLNGYTYAHGSAIMLSAAYSKPGLSMLIQAKRSDNMEFRSKRSESVAASYINNLPAFAYMHTYALASLYPYATQAAPGEYALQGEFAYTFKRKSALGGKYGTKVKLNASYICGIDRTESRPNVAGNLMGTDWHVQSTEGIGDTYYTDINLQVEKKLTRDFQMNFMYMFQKYNKTVVEGHGGMINSNIFIGEGKWKINKKLTLRCELQYLQTKDDMKDWCYGLAELSVLPYLMFTVSDMYNNGGRHLDKNEYKGAGEHYYMFAVTGNYRSNRLMVGYARTRAGFNCAGGVCRYVPATRGFQITYSYNF